MSDKKTTLVNTDSIKGIRGLIDTVPSKNDYEVVADKLVSIIKDKLSKKQLLIMKPGKEVLSNDKFIISRYYTLRLALPEDDEVFNEITLLTQVLSGYEEDITDALFDKLSELDELSSLVFIKKRENSLNESIRTEPITNHSFTLEVYREEDSDLLLDAYTNGNTLLELSNGKTNKDKLKLEGNRWIKI